jgi:hypothetical protein
MKKLSSLMGSCEAAFVTKKKIHYQECTEMDGELGKRTPRGYGSRKCEAKASG